MNIKVSLIIPVYNVERYLKECLESAFNQTLKEIEVIAVNDGSTDNSLLILNEYKAKHKNMIIINQENKGLSEARNSGLRVAKGEYIYFLDSDDYIDKNLAYICYNECKKNNLDIVTFDANVFYENKYLTMKNQFDYDRKNLLVSQVKSGQDFYIDVINKNAYKSSVCLFFYKRQFIEDNNLKFYSGILHEDELYSTKSIILSQYIKYIPKSFFYRRVRDNSIMTRKKSIKNAKGYLTVAEQLYKFYKENYLEKNCSNILLNSISHFYHSALYCTLQLEEYNKEFISEIKNSVKNKREIKGLKLNIKLFLARYLYIRNTII